MKKSILNLNKRHFSTTLVRLTDSSPDIFARLDALIKGNKEQIKEIKSVLDEDKTRRIKEEIVKIDEGTTLEEKRMKEHLNFLTGKLGNTNTVDYDVTNKYYSEYTRMKSLIEKRKEEFSHLDRDNPDFLKKVFDIVKLDSNVTNKYLDKLENDVNKMIERDRVEKGGSTDSGHLDELAKDLRSKERREYLKKEQDSFEKINKEFESKKEIETPTEYVQSLSETEMPSYMDPED